MVLASPPFHVKACILLIIVSCLLLAVQHTGAETAAEPSASIESHSGHALVRNSLSASLRTANPRFHQAEPIRLEVLVTNISGELIRFHSVNAPEMYLVIADQNNSHVWKLEENHDPALEEKSSETLPELGPGKSWKLHVTLDKWATNAQTGQQITRSDAWPLPAGVYTARAVIGIHPFEGKEMRKAPLLTNSAVLSIVD